MILYNIKKITFSLMAVVAPYFLFGQDVSKVATETSSINILNLILAIIMLFLLIPVYNIGQTLTFSARKFVDMEQKKSNANKGVGILLLLLFASQVASAQSGAATSYMFQFNWLTWVLLFVIALEVFLLAYFSAQANSFLNPKDYTSGEYVYQPKNEKTWWDKINAFKSADEEGNIDTGHSYDGIRELDNITPPWFTVSFGLTIVFAVIYLWRYHVTESAPLQIQEYEIEMAQADLQDAARLSSQSNKVDESNLVMLGADGIADGKRIFTEKCAVCHGATGGSAPGGVGPNLTDDHWIHGGSIKDVFKSIKYGWPDKGMIAWKDQLTANQIAQLSSFIMAIKGSNPPGAKEPQGEVYVETAEAAPTAPQDTTKTK